MGKGTTSTCLVCPLGGTTVSGGRTQWEWSSLPAPPWRSLDGRPRLSRCLLLPAPPAGLVQEFPSLIKPLLTERDQFMTFMLRKLAGRADVVVAVVGAGHLQGIRCAGPAGRGALGSAGSADVVVAGVAAQGIAAQIIAVHRNTLHFCLP